MHACLALYGVPFKQKLERVDLTDLRGEKKKMVGNVHYFAKDGFLSSSREAVFAKMVSAFSEMSSSFSPISSESSV